MNVFATVFLPPLLDLQGIGIRVGLYAEDHLRRWSLVQAAACLVAWARQFDAIAAGGFESDAAQVPGTS